MTSERLDIIEEITGRLLDLFKPVLQISRMVCPKLSGELIMADIGKKKQKEESNTREEIIRIIYSQYMALKKVYGPGFDGEIPLSWVCEDLNKGVPEAKYKTSSSRLTKSINAMGIQRKKRGGSSRILIDEKILMILTKQYDLPNEVFKREDSDQKKVKASEKSVGMIVERIS